MAATLRVVSDRPPTRVPFDEDQRLIALCRAGDARAWEALVRRHERLVYAVARSYRLSDSDLGDVFQEVFAALVKGLPRLRDPRSLVRWLSSTTERIARATALRRRREDFRSVEIDADASPELRAEDGPPGADLERLEEQALVRIALDRLGSRCRDLLELLYYADPAPSYGDIAKRLGIAIGSIGPTRARCFDRLRADLAQLVAANPGINPATLRTSTPVKPSSGEDPVRGAARSHGLGGST
jgi:RNA polymerase sigma factor (sigma-70 family)